MKKNICVWTILVRIFGPSSRNNHPKLLFFFRFGRCIFCLQPRPTSFKKNTTNHLIKLTFQNGAFFPGEFRRWSLTTPLQRRVSPPNASIGPFRWMPNYTPVEHAKFSIWNKSDMFLGVFRTWEVQYITRPYKTFSYLFCFDFARLQIMYMTALLFLSGLRMHPRHLQNPLAKCQAPRCHKTSLVDLEFHLQGRKELYIYIYYMNYMCI